MRDQMTQTEGKIEEMKSLMVNWGLNCINLKSKTKMQKTCNYKVTIDVYPRTQLHNIKHLKLIRGVEETN
jgi:FKBP-type peptidyl-prolyl cis-trans isomerase (trigger factor)